MMHLSSYNYNNIQSDSPSLFTLYYPPSNLQLKRGEGGWSGFLIWKTKRRIQKFVSSRALFKQYEKISRKTNINHRTQTTILAKLNNEKFKGGLAFFFFLFFFCLLFVWFVRGKGSDRISSKIEYQLSFQWKRYVIIRVNFNVIRSSINTRKSLNKLCNL